MVLNVLGKHLSMLLIVLGKHLSIVIYDYDTFSVLVKWRTLSANRIYNERWNTTTKFMDPVSKPVHSVHLVATHFGYTTVISFP